MSLDNLLEKFGEIRNYETEISNEQVEKLDNIIPEGTYTLEVKSAKASPVWSFGKQRPGWRIQVVATDTEGKRIGGATWFSEPAATPVEGEDAQDDRRHLRGIRAAQFLEVMTGDPEIRVPRLMDSLQGGKQMMVGDEVLLGNTAKLNARKAAISAAERKSETYLDNPEVMVGRRFQGTVKHTRGKDGNLYLNLGGFAPAE